MCACVLSVCVCVCYLLLNGPGKSQAGRQRNSDCGPVWPHCSQSRLTTIIFYTMSRGSFHLSAGRHCSLADSGHLFNGTLGIKRDAERGRESKRASVNRLSLTPAWACLATNLWHLLGRSLCHSSHSSSSSSSFSYNFISLIVSRKKASPKLYFNSIWDSYRPGNTLLEVTSLNLFSLRFRLARPAADKLATCVCVRRSNGNSRKPAKPAKLRMQPLPLSSSFSLGSFVRRFDFFSTWPNYFPSM